MSLREILEKSKGKTFSPEERKRIHWVSRHKPLESQLRELRRLFGEVDVIYDPRTFASAEEIKERFEKARADEMVVVAPLSVIQRLTELGIKPLWAEMKLVSPEEAEIEVAGRHYKFERFRRIKGVKLEFEEI